MIRHLRWPVTATHLGMIAEHGVRAFWPFATIGMVLIAAVLFNLHIGLSSQLFIGIAALSGLALLVTLVIGVRSYRHPTLSQAITRVDAQLRGRPLAAMEDALTIGQGDHGSEAVWAAHIARMTKRSKDAKPVAPDLQVADLDPFGLRLIALLFLVCGLIFGTTMQTNQGQSAGPAAQVLASGPVWEGWIEPPTYTGKPAIYLNDVPQGALRIPIGSNVTLRLYGDAGAFVVAHDLSDRAGGIGPKGRSQHTILVQNSGTLAIEGENGATWTITAVADDVPFVELTGPIEADAMGELSQPFLAMDDYGVEAGTAVITLDLDQIERQHGLIAHPDDRGPLVLDLPMPFNGDRRDFDSFLVEDLSTHAFANMPVILKLQVVDGAGQSAVSDAEPMILPGRRFFQPFAKAVIEQRRDLLWAKSNAARVAQIMRAISHRPEGVFSNQTTYLRLRAIIRRLDVFSQLQMSDDVQNEIAAAMWELAIQLEEGTLADARERLRRAQERLSEAMRNGASDAEIADLMQELREATDDYMQLLADQMEPSDGTDQADSSQDSQEISQDEIQALMDRIQELMEQGRMAEAEALMDQLNELLENLRMTAGEGGDGPRTPGQQSMQDLADTLDEQQELSDDAFNELQDRANQQQGQQQGQQGQQDQQTSPNQQGQQDQPGQQNGQQGQGMGVGDDNRTGQQGDGGAGNDGRELSLAERQQALRDELRRQREGLPNLEGEAGDVARRALEQAQEAMDGAEQALRDGNLAQAIDQQAEAMNALRNGMRSLNEALAQNRNNDPGQGTESGETTGQAQPTRRDPLGRELGNTGQFGTDENLLSDQDIQRKADELLGEIRRRSSEQDRPKLELDYLRRLLDQF